MKSLPTTLLLALALALAAAPSAGAVISNGTIQLGVNATGELNYDCAAAMDTGCPDASLAGEVQVGLRYVPLNADGTGPGCDCEGWGMADAKSGLSGWANVAEVGADPPNVTRESFTAAPDGRSAVSTVTIADPDDPDDPEDTHAEGYSMRVGLEDGATLPDGSAAPSNAALVAAAIYGRGT